MSDNHPHHDDPQHDDPQHDDPRHGDEGIADEGPGEPGPLTRVPAPRPPSPMDPPPPALPPGQGRSVHAPAAGPDGPVRPPAPAGPDRLEPLDLESFPPGVALPRLLGFSATDSLVVIGLGDALHDGRPLTVARHSAGDLGVGGTGFGLLWSQYLAMCGQDTHTVTVIGYLDTADARARTVLTQVAAACPVPVRDVALIGSDRWWLLNCAAPSVCGVSPGCRPAGAAITPGTAPDPFSPGLLPLQPPKDDSSWQVPDDATVGEHGWFDVPALPEETPAREAVAALLPVRRTGDPGIDRLVFRNLLDLEHAECRNPSSRPMNAALTAALLQGLADTEIADGCLAWTDPAAWRLYLALTRNAPPGWASPAWTLIAAHAYRHGRLTAAQTAAERALADRPDAQLAGRLHEALDRGDAPRRTRWALDARAARVPTRLQPESTRHHRRRG